MQRWVKALIYIGCILVTFIFSTWLSVQRGYMIGGLGTVIIYGVGCYLAPRTIINYIENRKK